MGGLMEELKRDIEVDNLRRAANVSNMELANHLHIGYGSMVQRIGGFARWQPGEREKVIEYINNRLKHYESNLQ